MKTLKFNHVAAQAVVKDGVRATWRVGDDKDIVVDDRFELIDKVVAKEPATWQTIGVGVVDSVQQKRLGELTDEEMRSILVESSSALLQVSREYYGERVSPQTPVKLIRFDFSPYEQPKTAATTTEPVKEMKLYADGGSRGNPGPSASGYVLLAMDDEIIARSGIYLGITTNNQAEYQAVKFGLEEALKRGCQELDVYLDSLLVVNQMKGVFKVRNRDLWPIHQAIKGLSTQFKRITFTHVPRELNKLADAEVNKALDAELKG